jgi:hypothetical protein
LTQLIVLTRAARPLSVVLKNPLQIFSILDAKPTMLAIHRGLLYADEIAVGKLYADITASQDNDNDQYGDLVYIANKTMTIALFP